MRTKGPECSAWPSMDSMYAGLAGKVPAQLEFRAERMDDQ